MFSHLPYLRSLAFATCLLFVLPLGAEENVAAQVDRLFSMTSNDVPTPPLVGDAHYLRRVYLDFAGRVPAREELERFLNDPAADKRTAILDLLLASPEYPRRMRELFGNMLMERRGENTEWSRFLESSFAENKPWDQFAREILAPDSENEALRGAAFFHTRRLEKVGQQETDYPGLARDVGRLFLGIDLQCAQCHNHLFIESYKQQDFQGLFTVYQNTFIRNDLKFPALAEKVLSKKQEFMSVFDKIPLTTGPRVPGGVEIEIPTFGKNEEYLQPPDRKTNFPGVPKFSPLKSLAAEIAAPTNTAFTRNIVNRVWFVLLGRGLVHPLDQQHVANPPSHPELMELLTREFAAHRLDLKWLLRELALTQAYQRASAHSNGIERPLSAEQIMRSVLVATGPRQYKPLAADAEEKIRVPFVKAFGNPAAEPELEFSPSLKSALFVLNDPLVIESLQSQEGNLVERLSKQGDAQAFAEELYLAILIRSPSEEERTLVAEVLQQAVDRKANAIANMVWGLLASTEFCLNH